MPKLRQTFFWAFQTSSTMTVPISPYTSHYYHQFFSSIYPYKPAQDLLSSISWSTCTFGGMAFFFFRWHLWSDSSCVALRSIEHSPASQCSWNTEAVAYFIFFSFGYDCARPISMSPFIGGAFVRVFILHLAEVVDKRVIHYFSGPTLTFIHLHQGSLDKCSCCMDLDHVFLHHPIPYRL